MSDKTVKKPKPDASAWLAGGHAHRPAHQQAKASATVKGDAQRGGRPKAFEEEVERLNLMLPKGLVERIRLTALKEKKTPGQVVAEWIGTK